MTIDTHVHFYDPTRPEGVPWPKPDNKLLYRTVLPADYQTIASEIGVDGVVVVEASPWLEDNQWILDLAEDNRMILGFVGNIDLYNDDAVAHLDRFSPFPLFKGIRKGRVTASELQDPSFCQRVQKLVDLDLSLDLLARPDDLPVVASLVDTVEGLRVILDHATHVPVTTSPPSSRWIDDIHALGSLPSVYCKISGLIESAGDVAGEGADVPLASELYNQYLGELYSAFGSDRLLFATNWPVVDRACSAKQMVDAVMPFFANLGSEVVAKVLGKNAVKAYRLNS